MGPPYTFNVSSESNNRPNTIFDSIDKPRLCRDSFRIISFQSDPYVLHRRHEVRVKVPSFESHTFYYNTKHSTVKH